MYQKFFKPLAIFSNVGTLMLFLCIIIVSNTSEEAAEKVFGIVGTVVSILIIVLSFTFVITFIIAAIKHLKQGFHRKSTAAEGPKQKEDVPVSLLVVTIVMFLLFMVLFNLLMS